MRVALVAGPDPGHAFPVIALAVALRKRGHSALVVTGTRWHAPALRDGVEVMDLPFLAVDHDEDFGARMWRRSVAMTGPLAEQLAPWSPDLVVADTLTICGSFVAGVLGLPWVEVLPHPLQDPSDSLPPSGHGLAAGSWWLTRRRDALLRKLSEPAVAQGLSQRRAALFELGLDACDPVSRLVGTLPALEPARADWPANAVVVGALEWDPVQDLLAVPEGDGPIVLVGSSTASGTVPVDLLDVTIQAVEGIRAGLGGDPLAVRVVCADLGEPRSGLPPWAAMGQANQLDLLGRASLVVCGGGGGILAKALTRGVPVVTIPGAGDQRENSARVRRLGAGVLLRPGRLTAARLGGAIRRGLTEPGFARAARAASVGARGLGADHAAELVDQAVAAGFP